MRGPCHDLQKPLFNGSPYRYLRSIWTYFRQKHSLNYFNQNIDAVFCHYPDAFASFRKEGFTGPLYMQTQVGVNEEWFHEDIEARKAIREKYNLGDAFVFGSASRFTTDKGIDDIINVVCKHFGLDTTAIHTKSRKREVVQARQVAMYLAKTHTDFSTSKIGKFIGNKDHATVLHACKTVKGQCEVDKSFRSDLENIEALLKKKGN